MAIEHIALIFLSSLFHAVWNILTQTSRNSQFLSGLKGVWIMAVGLVLMAVNGVGHLPPEIWQWIVISGILHGTYILSLSKAYNTTDISYVYPIARSAPVFVPLFAWWWLDEHLGFTSFLAIGAILLAVYILHFKGKLLEGFNNVWDAIGHKDLRWAFITLALVVSYSLIDKRGMDLFLHEFPERSFINGMEFFFFEATIGFTLCNLYLFLTHRPRDILEVWGQEKLKGFIAGLTTIGSYGLICVVLQFEAVSQVVAVRQVSVMMVVLWGVIKLKEPFGTQRILAGAMIAGGVALIGMD